MDWTYSGVFTVYSVGDGLFMKRVLDGLAGLSNSGVLASLGALGLMVGLILIGLKGAATGGKGLDLGALLLSFILYVIMFAGKADVIIFDVGLSPGEATENTYTVDNIPFGVALLGSAISTIGVELTERLEQAYGMPNEVQSVRSVGFGRSLDWLAAVRFARSTDTNSANNAFQRYRRNLVNYMRYCSSQVIVREPQRVPRMLSSADPLDTANGFGLESGWVTTTWLPANGGAQVDVTCTAALANLNAYKDGGTAFADWANAVAGPMGFSGTTQARAQAEDAFATVNIAADDAQKYMLAAVTNAAWRDALSGMPVLGSQQVMHAIMTTQGAEQRATEFAGQESLFRRMMRPLMAFLESMVYAVAPFMAMAVGLGKFGLSMIGRYCLITAWVSLWMPTLAIINMFQITMAERAIRAVLGPPGGGSGYDIGSMAGSARVEDTVVDWIGTGALLAASTPMITLMLLFGSAMTAVGLANQLKGGDVIDQKGPSPDAVKNGPAMNHAAGYNYSRGGGTIESGASVPSFEFGKTAQLATESARQALSASSNKMEAKFGQEISSALTHDMSRGVGVSDKGDVRMSQAETRATEAVGSQVAGFESIGSAAQRMVMSTAVSETLGAKLDLGQATKAIAGMLGGVAEKMGKEKGAEYIQNLAKSVGAGGGAELQGHDKVERVAEGLARMSQGVRAEMRTSDGLKAEVMGASSAAVEQTARETGTASQRVAGSSGFAQMREDMQQKQQSYREASSANESAGMRQSVPLNEVAQSFTKSGVAPAAIRAAQELGSPQAYSEAVNQLAASGKFGDLKDNKTQIEAAAAAMVLNDSVPGGTPMNPATAGDRAQALMGFLTESGAVNTSAGSRAAAAPNASSENAGVADGVKEGAASDLVAGANVGAAPGTAEGAKAAFSALGTAEGRQGAIENAGNAAGVNTGLVQQKQAVAEGNANSNGDATFESQMNAPGGDQVRAEFNSRSDGVKAMGAAAVDPQIAANEANNGAIGPAGEGITGAGMGSGLNRAMGRPSGGGVTDGFVNWERLGMAEAAPAGNEPVADFGALKANAAGGGYSAGFSVAGNEAAQTVLAGMAAENRGTPLSSEQRSEVAAAWSSLDQNDKTAISNINEKWAFGESHPGVVPLGSARELSRDSEGSSAYEVMNPAGVARDYMGLPQAEDNARPGQRSDDRDRVRPID